MAQDGSIDLDVAKLQRFCDQKVREGVRDQLMWEVGAFRLYHVVAVGAAVLPATCATLQTELKCRRRR